MEMLNDFCALPDQGVQRIRFDRNDFVQELTAMNGDARRSFFLPDAGGVHEYLLAAFRLVPSSGKDDSQRLEWSCRSACECRGGILFLPHHKMKWLYRSRLRALCGRCGGRTFPEYSAIQN